MPQGELAHTARANIMCILITMYFQVKEREKKCSYKKGWCGG